MRTILTLGDNEMDFPTLTTNRLKLVHIDHQYDQAFFDIMSDGKVTEYYGMESSKSIDQAAKIIDSFQDTYKKKQGMRWGIIWEKRTHLLEQLG